MLQVPYRAAIGVKCIVRTNSVFSGSTAAVAPLNVRKPT
jgi:hypothetical protein